MLNRTNTIWQNLGAIPFILCMVLLLLNQNSCDSSTKNNAAKDILYYPEIHEENPDIFKADSLCLAGQDSAALQAYVKSVTRQNKNDKALQHSYGKILLISRDSVQQKTAFHYLKNGTNLIPTALIDLAEYQINLKDTCLDKPELESFENFNIPPHYAGRAYLALARYYEGSHYNFDSIWHYLNKAQHYFSETGYITFHQVTCLETLSTYATYRRKNLLAIRYANALCTFDKYWPKAEREDSASAYANRAYMLFREDDFKGSSDDIQRGLSLIIPEDNPEIYQSLMKSYLAMYMLRGQDSLWWNVYRNVEKNVQSSGKDYIESKRWLGQYLHYTGQYKEAIHVLGAVWKKEIKDRNTHSARYSTLCYLLSDASLQTGDIQQALQYMYANQRRFDVYNIDSMLAILATEPVYPFSPATECANIYYKAYKNTGQVEYLKHAEKFIKAIDNTLYSHMKVDEENALLQFYFETGRNYFDLGLHVNYHLFRLTRDTFYQKRFLEYSEKRKSSLLHKDMILGWRQGDFTEVERKLRAQIKEEKRKGFRDNRQFNALVDDYENLEIKYPKTVPEKRNHILLENIEKTKEVLSDMTKNGKSVLLIDETAEVWYYTLVNSGGTNILAQKYSQDIIDSVLACTDYLARHQLKPLSKDRFKPEVFMPREIVDQLREKVIVIPDGVYHRMPWEDIFPRPRYDIQHIPSVRVWKVLFDKKSNAPLRKVVAFAFSDPETIRQKSRTYLAELPGTYREVMNLRKKYPSTAIYTGNEATIENFWKVYEDPEIDYIHLALHGKANSVEKDDVKLYFRTRTGGLDSLYGYELLAHRSSCQKVVLSACQSGLGKYIAGEGNYSLPRYFMLNGAYDIQSNLWDVVD